MKLDHLSYGELATNDTDSETVGDRDPHISLRHISSIQVRNLTPFPARDSLASALLEPHAAVGPSSGLAFDDADIAVSRRRSRRISASSVRTLKGLQSDQDNERTPSPTTSPVRNRANSRASMQTPGASSSSPGTKKLSGMTAAGPSRPKKSTFSNAALPEEPLSLTLEASPSTLGSMWNSETLSSQKQLEEVIWSRLVETFLTISVSYEEPLSPTKKHPPTLEGQNTDKAATSQSQKKEDRSTSTKASQHSRQAAAFPSPVQAQQTSASQGTTFPCSPPLTPPPRLTSEIPVYTSPIHYPSTNPKFTIESESIDLEGVPDLATEFLTVRLWGHIAHDWGSPLDRKGKAKAGSSLPEDYTGNTSSRWKVIAEWPVHLNHITEVFGEADEIPANTLIMAFSSSDSKYYVPVSVIEPALHSDSAQSINYNSDSEVTLKGHLRYRKKMDPNRGRQRNIRTGLKSASVNDLLNLLNLQTSVIDAQRHLQDALNTCDRIIDFDQAQVLRREYSEGEYRIQRMHEQRDELEDVMKLTREDIDTRKDCLRQRRLHLAKAQALHEGDRLLEADNGILISEARKQIHTLKSSIEPVQASLLSTLSFIFPIELLSPPDLLYTILEVPLPIPLQGNDPAPPLCLPGEYGALVNEDSVATALGYAALVVQLTATYLCQRLVYPITYCGSRSLMKDPISSMVGPRMFPLFTKGVDTYRFEYAVFLLNKDIELLMADRNLRALDHRHTLPNLKNLLLTLTSNASVRLRPRPSTVSISTGLTSPEPQKAIEEIDPPDLPLDASTTPKVKRDSTPKADIVRDGDEGNVSGSTDSVGNEASAKTLDGEASSGPSSTTSTLRPRMPRLQIQSYLGFPPLSSMWRGKPPAIPNASTEVSEAEVGVGGFSGIESDENAVPNDSDSSARMSTEAGDERAGNGDTARARPGSEYSENSDTSIDSHDSVETHSTPPTSAFSDSYPDNMAAFEDGGSGEDEDEDDDDDRKTLRGLSTPTTPTAERPDSVFGSSMLNTLKARVQRRTSNSHVNLSPAGDPERERRTKRGSAEKDASAEKRRMAAKSRSREREEEEAKTVDGVIVK